MIENLEQREDTYLAKLAELVEPHEREALAFLLPLSSDYPGFERWFLSRVVPGLHNQTRQLVRFERDGRLIGVGIGKKDDTESKICTVRIAESHFGRGLGLRIFDALLDWLDTDQPHLTVSEKKLPAFERIFAYYRFQITSAYPDLYVRGAVELAYNEPESVSMAASKLNAPLASAIANGIPRWLA